MEPTATDGHHERDHRAIEEALTPSRRRWLVGAHLKRFHGLDASSFDDPEKFHADRHYDRMPSVCVARAQRQTDALIWALTTLLEVDAEAGAVQVRAALTRLGELQTAQPQPDVQREEDR